MAITHGNKTTQAFGLEPSPNTEPTATPPTFYLSPTSFSTWGPQPERITSNPIGPNIMAEAGTVIRTMAPAGFQGNFNRDHFRAFLHGAMRRNWTGATRFYPTEVRGTDYVVAANGALAEGTLVYARGFATAANNGLKVVGALSDATHVVASGLTAETLTSGQGATLEVCGWQFAAGDAQINASGHLIATAKDLTQLGLVAGQMIWIGGAAGAPSFAVAANRGWARVAIAPAASLVTLENTTTTFAIDNGATKTIQIFFGQFVKVVPSNDANYAEPTFQLEYGHATLSAGSAAYQYVTGCAVLSWALSLPTAAQATLTVGFDGRGTVAPTATRRTSFAAPVRQNAAALLNTADHVKRGRLRQGSTALTGYIVSADLTIATNANRNEAHGQQDSVETTYGDVDITASVQAHFSTMELIPALTADTLCNADWIVRSGGDGWAAAFDIPALQITSAPPSIDPAKVTGVTIGLMAVRDPVFNTVLQVSDFPYVPAS